MNTKGIGGSTIEAELNAIKPEAHLVQPIQKEEFQQRIDKACHFMQEQGEQVVYLHSGSNLYYFTGTRWSPSERMMGALLFPNGELHYISPAFEKGTVLDFMAIEGEVHCWEEDESPFELFGQILSNQGLESGNILIDEITPFFMIDAINLLGTKFQLKNAKTVTAGCRMQKSKNELAIMQAAMNITLKVQQAAARILYVGISAKEVIDFIEEAHKRYGIASGSYFCIVLFGPDTAFPHGVSAPKNLEMNDMVLIDTGCMLLDYISDLTRTYVFGKANEEQRRIWNIEKECQLAAFEAAKIGNPCKDMDLASRAILEKHQLGPDYQLPGLPHRTGHGIGLDIHEWPYIVRNSETILKPGMTFSIEPMICVPNKFGIRLEDHIYMTAEGPKWFTEPADSIENPFGV